jgi:hypothetical protein
VTGRVVEVGAGMVGSKEVSLLASTNIAGKFGIDQTTDGTTNRVVAKISQVEGENLVQLSGSKMELYGVAIEDRPDANTVAVGATFTIVDDTGNFDSYISNGTDWLEV